MKFRLILAAIAVTLGAFGGYWVSKNTLASQMQIPPVQAENLTAPIGLVGGRIIDPAPSNLQRSLNSAEIANIVGKAADTTSDFPQMIPQAKQLRLQFGIYRRTNLADPLGGLPIFVLSGDNAFDCVSSGGGPVRVNGRLQTSAPVRGTCRWVMILNANSGEAMLITESSNVFCPTASVRC